MPQPRTRSAGARRRRVTVAPEAPAGLLAPCSRLAIVLYVLGAAAIAVGLWAGGARPDHFGIVVSAFSDRAPAPAPEVPSPTPVGDKSPASAAAPAYVPPVVIAEPEECLGGPPFAAVDIGVEPTQSQERDILAEFTSNLRTRLLVDASTRTRSAPHHSLFERIILAGEHSAAVVPCVSPVCEHVAGAVDQALDSVLEALSSPAIFELERAADAADDTTALLAQVAAILRLPLGRKSLTLIYGADAGAAAAVLAAVCAAWPAGNVDAVGGLLRVYPTVRATVVPPHRIPPTLYAEFTVGGLVPVEPMYFNEAVDTSVAPIVVTWTAETIARFAGMAARREENYYGSLDSQIYRVLDRNPVRGKAVLIMGSLVPWYEMVAFEFGAAEVLTVDYGARVCDDPRIHVVTPAQFKEMGRKFDVVFSFSSLEHDGLGRYGDPLDGEADLKMMAYMRDHVVKPGGLLFFAVTMGKDTVYYNAHRYYGDIRWPLMTKGWRIVDQEGVAGNGFQNPFVLTPE